MISLTKVSNSSIVRSGILSYLGKVGFYSGPESTGSLNEDVEFGSCWESQKRQLIQKKVKLLGQGIDVENDLSLIDEKIRKVNELPHHIMVDDLNRYYTEDFPSDYFNITGSNVTATPDKSFSSLSNVDPDFYKPEVQEILKRITGKNMNKIFATKIGQHTEMPRVRLLTTQQLEEEIKKKELEAESLLRMPPVMNEREEIDDIIAHDTHLDGYEECNVAFVDISEDLPKTERFMVVREPTGVLRKAKWDERDRYQQIYFPIQDRHIVNKPWLFTDLSTAFKNNMHLNVMEQILIEYEPDSKEYISLFQAVYNDINDRSLFSDIHSTRYFGGLAFYLCKHRTIDNLLSHMVQNSQIEDAADLVHLFSILHPEDNVCKSNYEESSKSIENLVNVIQSYISTSKTVDKKSLGLSLEAFRLNLSENN